MRNRRSQASHSSPRPPPSSSPSYLERSDNRMVARRQSAPVAGRVPEPLEIDLVQPHVVLGAADGILRVVEQHDGPRARAAEQNAVEGRPAPEDEAGPPAEVGRAGEEEVRQENAGRPKEEAGPGREHARVDVNWRGVGRRGRVRRSGSGMARGQRKCAWAGGGREGRGAVFVGTRAQGERGGGGGREGREGRGVMFVVSGNERTHVGWRLRRLSRGFWFPFEGRSCLLGRWMLRALRTQSTSGRWPRQGRSQCLRCGRGRRRGFHPRGGAHRTRPRARRRSGPLGTSVSTHPVRAPRQWSDRFPCRARAESVWD